MPQKTKSQRLVDTVTKLQDGLQELRDITDEMQEWKNNMEGTPLENTHKYTNVEEKADTLSQAADEIESAIEDIDGLDLSGQE